MMVVGPQHMHMSVDEYLAYDRAGERKHEYGDGKVLALTGGTVAHNDLTVNLVLLLREQLGHKGPCYAYASDLRVLVAKTHYFYPDVVVSCDMADRQEGSDIIRTPHLVVEVLSPSTEAKDRGYKLRCYQQCPSIQEYVLVNTQWRRCLHRQAGGVTPPGLAMQVAPPQVTSRVPVLSTPCLPLSARDPGPRGYLPRSQCQLTDE